MLPRPHYYSTILARKRVFFQNITSIIILITIKGANFNWERNYQKLKASVQKATQKEKGGCFVTHPLFATYKSDPLKQL